MNKNTLIRAAFLSVMLFCMAMPSALAQQSDLPSDLSVPQFFTSLEDVPLMPGLTELTELTVSFDKPEGRIIESVAAIESVSLTDIKHFYEASLPQLGWNRIGDNSFARRGEYLKMNFETIEGQEFLKIIIMPHG